MQRRREGENYRLRNDFEGEAGPVAFPVGLFCVRSALHVDGVEFPEAGRVEGDVDLALRVRSADGGFLDVFAGGGGGFDVEVRGGGAVEENLDGEFIAGLFGGGVGEGDEFDFRAGGAGDEGVGGAGVEDGFDVFAVEFAAGFGGFAVGLAPLAGSG